MTPARGLGLVVVAALWLGAAAAPEVRPPVAADSVRFLVLGDTGTGDRYQRQVADQAAAARALFPFTFALMLGDNIYGSERPQDFDRKFAQPYRALLDAGVEFHAALGNHDDPNQVFYEPFHMDGKRYHTFTKGDARFFALDSNYMDRPQIAWLRRELEASGERWKIAFFHHPLYSSGARHGSEVDLRQILEPLFLEHGVDVVFAGHEHFYERLKPQRGIYYFTAGGSAKLRAGNIRRGALTEVGFDRDRSFLLVELTRDALHFQALDRTGARIDAGQLPHIETRAAANAGGAW
jgi:predicted phosphodiesterase